MGSKYLIYKGYFVYFIGERKDEKNCIILFSIPVNNIFVSNLYNTTIIFVANDSILCVSQLYQYSSTNGNTL